MSSQPTVSSLNVTELQSYIRGQHVYKDVWTPVVGEVLLLQREPDNVRDNRAVAVLKEGQVVGHIPYNISAIVSHFLSRDYNKAFAEVTGDRVNRGGGYGIEVPCCYRFYGPELYLKRMKEITTSLASQGLI